MRKWTAVGAAIGVALLASASPVLARGSVRGGAVDWRAARAEAIGPTGIGGRAAALHECNSEASKFVDYSWGVSQTDHYRACMARHGQPE